MIEEDLIVQEDENENNVIQEEENIQDLQPSAEILVFTPQELDLATPFFNGVTISGVMCMISLGIAMVISMFRKA